MNFPTIDNHPPATVDPTKLVLKPETAFVCPPGSDYYGPTPDPLTLQFAAYLSDATGESAASAPVYASSDTRVMTINASTGLATAVAPGNVTISVTSGTRRAFSQITVLPADDCCGTIPVALGFVVDNSLSMTALFGAGYGTRLDVAKKLAYEFAKQLNDAKDSAGVVVFNEVGIITQGLTPVVGSLLDDGTIVQALGLISATDRKTSLLAGLEMGLLLLASTTNKRALLLFSDGENRPQPGSLDAETLANEATAFKAEGGIIICVGLRAVGAGYLALRDLASNGFFINVLDATGVTNAIAQLAGLQCYFCAGVRPMVDSLTCLASPIGAQAPDGTALTELEQSV